MSIGGLNILVVIDFNAIYELIWTNETMKKARIDFCCCCFEKKKLSHFLIEFMRSKNMWFLSYFLFFFFNNYYYCCCKSFVVVVFPLCISLIYWKWMRNIHLMYYGVPFIDYVYFAMCVCVGFSFNILDHFMIICFNKLIFKLILNQH